MEERLQRLEISFAYQEDTVNVLNSIIIEQGKKIDKLELLIEKLTKKVDELVEIAGEDSMPHERPPHY